MTFRPIHTAMLGFPLVALLLAVLAGIDQAFAEFTMPVGAALVLLGTSFSVAAVVGAVPRRAWAGLGLSLVLSGVIADPLVRLLHRPLVTSPADVIVPVLLLGVAAFCIRRRGLSLRAGWFSAVLVTAAAGVVISGAFGLAFDAVGLFMWTVAVFGLALMGGLLLARVLRGDSSSAVLVLSASVGCLTVLGAAVRQFAVLEVAEVELPGQAAALLAISAGAVLLLLVGLLGLLVPRALAVRRWFRAVVVVGACGSLLMAGQAAAVPLQVSPDRGVMTARVMSPTDALAGGGSSMLSDVGAMPRDEFRGMSFYECDALNSRDCFITHYDDIALKQGVNAAIEDLLGKVKENKGSTFPAHCHQVVHNLGQLAFILGDTFEQAAVLDPQVCGTGYTHGLWEQQFVLLGDDTMFSQTGTLCDELNMTTPWYKWTCSHILGHMMVTSMMDNPTLSLEYCTLIKEPQPLTDCQAGGWMNFFQDDQVIAEMVRRGSLEDLFSVCYGAADSVKFMCYQELFPVIYPMVGNDDYLAAQACLTYAEPGLKEGDPWGWDVSYADRCIQGLARAVTVSAFEDHRITDDRCLSMPEEAHDPCLTAGAASIVLNTGSTKAAFEVCRNVKDDEYRVYCYFWAKHSRKLLANGPNSTNLPGKDEIRLPEQPKWLGGSRSNPDQVDSSSVD